MEKSLIQMHIIDLEKDGVKYVLLIKVMLIGLLMNLTEQKLMEKKLESLLMIPGVKEEEVATEVDRALDLHQENNEEIVLTELLILLQLIICLPVSIGLN